MFFCFYKSSFYCLHLCTSFSETTSQIFFFQSQLWVFLPPRCLSNRSCCDSVCPNSVHVCGIKNAFSVRSNQLAGSHMTTVTSILTECDGRLEAKQGQHSDTSLWHLTHQLHALLFFASHTHTHTANKHSHFIQLVFKQLYYLKVFLKIKLSFILHHFQLRFSSEHFQTFQNLDCLPRGFTG